MEFYVICYVLQESKMAALSSLVRAPFSVLFDAVRCEDWLGQDSYLPFTKVRGLDGTGQFPSLHQGERTGLDRTISFLLPR